MTKDEGVAAARRGTRSLEAWLDTHSSRLDLSGADLSGCSLRWMNFAGANLKNTKFMNADLTGAYFGPASFSAVHPHVSSRNLPVDVSGANFSGANLLAATFNYPKIAAASFEKAYLGLTNFRSAVFQDNNFGRAEFINTGFFNCNLDGIKELNSIQHLGPSHIDVDTLTRSSKISEEFLGRIGAAPQAIGHLKAASEVPSSNFLSCFISHSTSDREFCDLLYTRMRKAGLRVWYAPEDMRAGKKIRPQISEAIQAHDKVVLVISESSMNSNWVLNEIKWSLRSKNSRESLFPICIARQEALSDWELIDPETGLNISDEIRSYFIPDFARWKDTNVFEERFRRLLRDLNPGEA